MRIAFMPKPAAAPRGFCAYRAAAPLQLWLRLVKEPVWRLRMIIPTTVANTHQPVHTCPPATDAQQDTATFVVFLVTLRIMEPRS